MYCNEKSAGAQQEAMDTLNRSILVFDYASYAVIREYQELQFLISYSSLRELMWKKSQGVRSAFDLCSTYDICVTSV